MRLFIIDCIMHLTSLLLFCFKEANNNVKVYYARFKFSRQTVQALPWTVKGISDIGHIYGILGIRQCEEHMFILRENYDHMFSDATV